jgi:flagellar basal-body rod protein FlgF
MMDNSVYVALSRQTMLFRDLDQTANNIANANTTGFQAEKNLFESYLMQGGGSKRDKLAFVQDRGSYIDETPGAMKVTGNPLDLAISGKGYFVVETAQGQAYTRNGAFAVDPNGTLVTSEGYPVLDEAGGRIEFQEEDNEIEVRENGQLMVDGEERGILGMVEFKNPQALERRGSNLFFSKEVPEQADPTTVDTLAGEESSRMLQGVLQQSNVQPVVEMIRLTELSRAAGSTAKYIEVMYDLQRKTSNAWTKQS